MWIGNPLTSKTPILTLSLCRCVFRTLGEMQMSMGCKLWLKCCSNIQPFSLDISDNSDEGVFWNVGVVSGTRHQAKRTHDSCSLVVKLELTIPWHVKSIADVQLCSLGATSHSRFMLPRIANTLRICLVRYPSIGELFQPWGYVTQWKSCKDSAIDCIFAIDYLQLF